MADHNDKETKRYRGTVKYLEQGVGYILPDIEVFVTPSSLSSNTIKQGDRVEFGIKFNDSNPNFEAIDVTPIEIQCFKCRKYGHSTKKCRKKNSISKSSPSSNTIKEGDRVEFGVEFSETNPNLEAIDVTPGKIQCSYCRKRGHSTTDCRKKKSISKSRCFRCGSIGHLARKCGGKRLVGPGVGSTSNSNSVVSVKKEEDVKKVEEVEDCFILEFDPSKKDDDDDDDDDERSEELRSIVCVKNVEDVKKVEEVEDCFILEFDPDEPVKFDNLSLCDGDSEEDVSIIAQKGQVACRDYPHPRTLCGIYPFKTTPHEIHCKMCYCYVCEKPAPCKSWTKGLMDPGLKHCDADDIPMWNTIKDFRKSQSINRSVIERMLRGE